MAVQTGKCDELAAPQKERLFWEESKILNTGALKRREIITMSQHTQDKPYLPDITLV